MNDNSEAPPRASLVHDQWIESMKRLASSSLPDTTTHELATFAGEILQRCGDTPELTDYLNARALKAMEA